MSIEPKNKFSWKGCFFHFLIIAFFLTFCQISYAGISVCYNPDNTVDNFSLRGDAIPNCVYYDAGQNVTQQKYDTVRNLLKTVAVRYLKKLNGDPVEMSPAEKVAVDDALALQLETQFRTSQKANFDGSQGVYLRALVQTLLNENNDLRQWITSFKAQTALATNLSNFQTRVASLPNTPDRTLTQAKTAIQAKIDDKSVDE